MSNYDDLTPAERQTLALVAEGCSNHAIASRRFVSEQAVEKHMSNVYWKLGLFENPDHNRRVKAALLYRDIREVADSAA